MSLPPASFIELAHWASVLDRLGAPPAADVLPAKVKCPACQRLTLAAYADHTAGGQRLHCSQCRWAGDPIQLAAKVWGITPKAAIVRLRLLHVPLPDDPTLISKYLSSLAYRKRALDFWQSARRRPVHHNNAISRLVQELGWRDGLSSDRRGEGPGRLFGWAPRLAVEQLFMPKAARGDKLGAIVSGDRVFTGKNWGNEVLVVPFWQLPYQLCGFMFIGRDGDPARDFVYRRLNIRADRGRHPEGGLTLHPQVPRVLEQNGRELLLMTDLTAATGWQIRQLIRDVKPLPLAVWQHGLDHAKRPTSTRSAWNWFSDQRLVFWMPQPSPTVIAQAAQLGARVTTSGPRDGTNLSDYLRRAGLPSSVCRRLLESARPWRSVFAELLERSPVNEATDLLLRFRNDQLPLDDILSRCPGSVRRRADQLLPPSHVLQTVTYKNDQVYEKDCSWYRIPAKVRRRPNPPRLICNAVIQVQQIVNLTGSPAAGHYRGEVFYKNKKLSFCVDKAVINRGFWKWLREFLIEQQAGTLQYDPTYGEPLQLAMTLHPPEIVEESASIGWQAARGELTLPQFSLCVDGTVRPRKPQPKQATLPGDGLPLPGHCSPIEIEGLVADPHGSPVMWAILAASLTNVLGEPFHEPRPSVALTGHGAEWTGRLVAAALGCPRFEITRKPELTQAAKQSVKHNWPAHFEISSALLRKTIQEWLRREQHNCLANLNEWNSLACQAEGGWLAVKSETGWSGDEVLLDSLRLFTSAYLQDVIGRRLRLQAPANASLCRQLLHDMAAFATQISESGQRILEALPLIRGDNPASRADAFAELLHLAVQRGKAVVRRQGFDDCLALQATKPKLYYDDQHLFVSRPTLSRLLSEVGAMQLRSFPLSQTLAAAGVLVDENPDGWRLRRAWWDEWRQRYVASQSTLTGDTAAKSSTLSSKLETAAMSGQLLLR